MPNLPTLADRVWYAYQCLARSPDGTLPSWKELERRHELAGGTISFAASGRRSNFERRTFERMAIALGVSQHWLDYGGPNGPTPPPGVIVPPRPGQLQQRYGDLPGWADAVDLVRKLNPDTPREAFLAGAELPVYRPVERVSPEIALSVCLFAWRTASDDDRGRFSTMEAKLTDEKTPKPRTRSAQRKAK